MHSFFRHGTTIDVCVYVVWVELMRGRRQPRFRVRRASLSCPGSSHRSLTMARACSRCPSLSRRSTRRTCAALVDRFWDNPDRPRVDTAFVLRVWNCWLSRTATNLSTVRLMKTAVSTWPSIRLVDMMCAYFDVSTSFSRGCRMQGSWGGYEKNRHFWPISRFSSEMIQDRAIVTMGCE